TAVTDIYSLSLHDALPICPGLIRPIRAMCELASYLPLRLIDLIASGGTPDFSEIARSCSMMAVRAGSSPSSPPSRLASTFRLERSEEHTSELQSRENLVCR